MADMFNAPWKNINNVANSDKAVSLFSSMFTCILDKHMPLVTKRVRHHNKLGWLNPEIKKAIHDRDFHKKKGNWTRYKKSMSK